VVPPIQKWSANLDLPLAKHYLNVKIVWNRLIILNV
jgi:hypothetical protein